MMSALYLTNMLSWIFIVLGHWNNSLWVDISLHSDTLSRSQATQSLIFLLNATCLAEKQQITILMAFSLTWLELEPTIYHTRGEQANYNDTDTFFWSLMIARRVLCVVWIVTVVTMSASCILELKICKKGDELFG